MKQTEGTERIKSLDILRGIAILGILIMNIQSFSMPSSAYINPTSFGDLEGINYWVWLLSHVLADQKFMAIFSVLFGAGVVLVTNKVEAKNEKSGAFHYKRTFWLLLIGLIHAHLIWYGDILVTYALCSFLIFFMRKWSIKKLFVIGSILLAVHPLLYQFFGFSMSFLPAEELLEMKHSFWLPTADIIQTEIAKVTGSLSHQLKHNSEEALQMEITVFLMQIFWRACGLMLIGMGLFKAGILSAQKENNFYKKGILIGLIAGFPLILFGIYANEQAGWTLEYSMFIGSQFNYVGSLGLSFAYICAIMLFSKSNGFQNLKSHFAAIGQTALTNYILQSMIGVLLFYGIGFGLFGQLERIEQLGVVVIVWALQLFVSRPWLKRFKFGPLEWLWRSLTYMKKQPFRRTNNSS